MRTIFTYLKRSLILELKKTIVYPYSFWIVMIVIPFYSAIQIIFLESIYAHTTNFVGYTKYEAYVLFGTYSIVQTLGHMLVYSRLTELKGLIRGDAQESFDIALTKPIDSQIYATLGRFNFGNIGPVSVGIFIVCYGLAHGTYAVTFMNLISYFAVVCLGLAMFYFTFLSLSTLLFKFPEMQMTEALWSVVMTFGQYSTDLYRGPVGVLLNIIIPVTLMASVPSNFLLGRLSATTFVMYFGIIVLLFFGSRYLWNRSVKQYSSFSS